MSRIASSSLPGVVTCPLASADTLEVRLPILRQASCASDELHSREHIRECQPQCVAHAGIGPSVRTQLSLQLHPQTPSPPDQGRRNKQLDTQTIHHKGAYPPPLLARMYVKHSSRTDRVLADHG